MNCPICDAAMSAFWKNDSLNVLKCENGECKFICLDSESWESPYSNSDYYQQINCNDVNPVRPFIKQRANAVAKYCGRDGRLAELGCGLGETALALLK